MRKDLTALVTFLAVAAPLSSQAEGFALGLRAGSTGIGAELTARLSDSFNVRVGGSGYSYNRSREVSDIAYDGTLHLSSGSAALDWHPGGSAFRLSAGLMLHGNKLSGVAVPTGTITIGNQTYTPSQIGTLTATADYDRHLAPFATIGAGNGARGGRVFVSFEAGVALSGTPKIALVASRSTADLDSNLQIEAQQVQDDLNWLKLYPIVSLGIGIRF
jgi:hypothetical protein